MKFINSIIKNKSLVSNLMLCSTAFLLFACGSGGGGSGSGGGTGSIAFTLDIQDNLATSARQLVAVSLSSELVPIASVKQSSGPVPDSSLTFSLSKLLEPILPLKLMRYTWFSAPTRAYADSVSKSGNSTAKNTLFLAQAPEDGIDCYELELSEIEAHVYDEKGVEIAEGGPWPCDQHKGTIKNVPAGDYRKIVIFATDEKSGDPAYRGEKGSHDDPITVLPGKTTAVGKIMLDPMEPPNTPVGLEASDGKFTDRIRLSWQDVKHEDGYYIYRSYGDSNEEQIDDTNMDITVFVDYDPACTPYDEDPILYYYRVQAYNEADESGFSKMNSGYTADCPIDVPAAPFNVNASETEDSDQIEITWEWAGIEPLDGFRIYRSESLEDPWGEPIEIIDADDRNYLDSVGCTDYGEPRILYYYMVRAYNSEGPSDESVPDSEYVPDCPIVAPDAPFYVDASDGDYPNQIEIKWEWEGNPPLDGFLIYRREGPEGPWDDGFQIKRDARTREYTDKDIDCKDSTKYYYMVAAYNSAGESGDSDSGYTADCPIFAFDTDSQKWILAGLYYGDSAEEIEGYFSVESKPWMEESASIGSGPGERLTMPPSPTEEAFLRYDLISPNLKPDNRWRGIKALRYDVKGGTLSSDEKGSKDVNVQTVLYVEKPDGTESYYTDKAFHNIPLGKPEELPWKTYTVDIAALKMPEGTIILNIIFRVFFLEEAEYDGYIWIDNVTGLF